MGMIFWDNAANLKWFWWKLERTLDLIRNLNIFPGQRFLSKNTDKTPTKAENDKIFQLVITHIFMGMIQWIHVAHLKLSMVYITTLLLRKASWLMLGGTPEQHLSAFYIVSSVGTSLQKISTRLALLIMTFITLGRTLLMQKWIHRGQHC